MGAGGSFPSTVEAPLELLRVGPLAAGPSPLPQALCGRAGAVPAGLLAPASLSPPQSLPLLCCTLSTCSSRASTHHKPVPPGCLSLLCQLTHGMQWGVSSRCPGLGGGEEWAETPGGV